MSTWRCLILASLLMTLGQPSFAQRSAPPIQMAQQSEEALEGRTVQPDFEQEPPEFKFGTLGICRIYNWSSYLALASDGQVVTLRQYCQQQRNWVWYEEGRFWERFRDVATAETMTFAQSLDQNRIETYAQAICPFLADGGSFRDLAKIQADPPLPANFEQAVTAAAVRTYCRQYRDQLPD